MVAVDRKEFPSRPRVRVQISATPLQPHHVMELIRTCNPNLPTEDWKFEDPAIKPGADTNRVRMQITLLLT